MQTHLMKVFISGLSHKGKLAICFIIALYFVTKYSAHNTSNPSWVKINYEE